MEANILLEDVQKKIAHWRQTRPYRRAKLPSKIAEDIKALGKHYKRSHLAATLHMSGAHINRLLHAASIDQSSPIKFSEISQPLQQFAVLETQLSSPISCTLQRMDGATLTLAVPNQQLGTLMEAFLCSK